jgi:hypothetical protein
MDEDWEDDGLTLWGDCGEFALRPGWWPAMLELARQYGWDPQGTQPPRDYWEWEGDPATWGGEYWPCVGQQVTDTDARHLGAALARALPDIPDHGGRPYFSRPGSAARPGPEAPPSEPPDVSAWELLSGAESKEVLGWFLQHCAGCVLRHCDGCGLPPSDGGCQHCKGCVLLHSDGGYGLCCGGGGFDIVDYNYDPLALDE